MKLQFEKIAPDSGSSFKLIRWRSEDDRFFWHQHPEYEIVYVKKGNGKMHVGNYLGNYEEGELMFLGPNLPHTGLGYGVIGEHEEIIVQLREDFLGEAFLNIPETEAIKQLFERSKRGITFHGNTQKNVSRLLEQLADETGFDRLITLLLIFKELALSPEFKLLNTDGVKFDVRHKDEVRINKIYEYVEEHYKEQIDIEDVAELSNLTVPSFCRYFKKMTRLTFTDFVNQYRVNQACKLLARNRSIADVCFESGFNNISHFNKVFKDLIGETPKNYREKAFLLETEV